jgi:6,7-dimethyl-8-ribityllumazine synthase
MGTTYRGELQGEGLRIAIVVSRFREEVTTRLLAGAQAALEEHNVRDEDVDVAWVPGAFELPLAARTLAAGGSYDAVVCLGAVIRGETSHDQYISHEAARGIGQASQETGVPIVFGVITPNSLEQAMDRAGGTKGNKGFDAAVTAIEMASVLRQIK